MAFAVSAGQAQQVAAPQILTLDQNRLFSEALYGKALTARSLAATQNLASENSQIEADLAAEEASLTTRRPTLTAADFAKLAADFDQKVERIRAAQDAKDKQLVTDRDAGRKQFFEAASPVLAELMRSLGAYAILNRGSVLLSFDSIDVTDRAIAALDARIGDGTKAPAQSTAPTDPALIAPAPPVPNP
jgi:Skp family chaperone for outer membrane proteins